MTFDFIIQFISPQAIAVTPNQRRERNEGGEGGGGEENHFFSGDLQFSTGAHSIKYVTLLIATSVVQVPVEWNINIGTKTCVILLW